MAVLNRMAEDVTAKCDVVGPLCTPLDVLGRGVDLPDVQIGDTVGIFQSGAYARSASPLGFLGHVTPNEVLVSNGRPREIRTRGQYEDLIRDVPISD